MSVLGIQSAITAPAPAGISTPIQPSDATSPPAPIAAIPSPGDTVTISPAAQQAADASILPSISTDAAPAPLPPIQAKPIITQPASPKQLADVFTNGMDRLRLHARGRFANAEKDAPHSDEPNPHHAHHAHDAASQLEQLGKYVMHRLAHLQKKDAEELARIQPQTPAGTTAEVISNDPVAADSANTLATDITPPPAPQIAPAPDSASPVAATEAADITPATTPAPALPQTPAAQPSAADRFALEVQQQLDQLRQIFSGQLQQIQQRFGISPGSHPSAPAQRQALTPSADLSSPPAPLPADRLEQTFARFNTWMANSLGKISQADIS
ncbi:MAG TPA: hypothetical protein VIL86_20455 [Tepidisphaeraceae bacterium]|jgi:hypothetical protein